MSGDSMVFQLGMSNRAGLTKKSPPEARTVHTKRTVRLTFGEFLTVMAALKSPAFFGVPLIRPVCALMDSPLGSPCAEYDRGPGRQLVASICRLVGWPTADFRVEGA